MKQNHLNRIALIAIGVFALMLSLSSCEKDKFTEPSTNIGNDKDEVVADAKVDRIVQRIKRFDNQIKEIKNGAYRGDEYMNADSALWNIESLFNTTYSFPDKNYVEKKIHELSFNIDVDNDLMSMKDVCTLYDQIVASVKEAYRNDGISSDKGLMSLFVEKGESRSGKLTVKVLAVTGRTDCHQIDYKPHLFGPFDSDECWYYGGYGGSCDDPYILNDAAELIEDTINYKYAHRPEIKHNYRNIYVDAFYIMLNGNEYWDQNSNDYSIFYKINCDKEELYLDGNEMNRYYYNEVELIKNDIPNDPAYSSLFVEDVVFIEINIDGSEIQTGNDVIYNHQNYIFYGSPYLIENKVLGNPVDLLKN